ncbi:MAG: restriction endonuclease subunit S, partial [Clostridia bacterium]|nr:restriction endonuclease subunit S [Clostridia bacterium]
YLDTANITNGKIDTIVKLNIKDIPSRAKRIVKKNDIIYSTVSRNLCHYGILRNIVDNMVVSTGFIVLTCKNEVNPEYLYAYLTLPEITKKLSNIAETSTSAYPSIKPNDIGELQIDLPNIEMQNKIAHVLKALDEKIEINNQINDNLYNVA